MKHWTLDRALGRLVFSDEHIGPMYSGQSRRITVYQRPEAETVSVPGDTVVTWEVIAQAVGTNVRRVATAVLRECMAWEERELQSRKD